jgi:hypothetical protein
VTVGLRFKVISILRFIHFNYTSNGIKTLIYKKAQNPKVKTKITDNEMIMGVSWSLGFLKFGIYGFIKCRIIPRL